MSDKWAEYKEQFCGCKDGSRLNSCKGLPNCELRAGHPERKTPSQKAMTSKLEISRELLTILADLNCPYDQLMAAKQRAAEILAAPVVERQKIRPVAYKFTRPGHIVILKEYNSPECYFRDPENWLCEPLYTSQPAPVVVVNLRDFANAMIDIALEGGNADGIQIQELAVEHGLLKPEQRTERCSDTCSCAEYADFPVECLRKVKELNQ